MGLFVTNEYTCVHTHEHTYTHTRVHTHTRTHTHTYTHTHVHTHTRTHTHTHTQRAPPPLHLLSDCREIWNSEDGYNLRKSSKGKRIPLAQITAFFLASKPLYHKEISVVNQLSVKSWWC